jgi:ABC-type Fe3+-hydroxamate transport system substrate-binding protein
VAARSQWARIAALQRNRVFLVDYAAARDGWLSGSTVAFPVGTYWLQQFAGVSIAAS